MMRNRIVVHIIEFILSILHIVLIWPVFVENDFLYGCLWCFGYLAIIAVYCGFAALIPAMKIACDVNDTQKTKGWTQLLSNVPWFLFSVFIIFVFGSKLGYLACLPIVIPNSIYWLLNITK